MCVKWEMKNNTRAGIMGPPPCQAVMVGDTPSPDILAPTCSWMGSKIWGRMRYSEVLWLEIIKIDHVLRRDPT